jgi:predicted dinucleotide-binding enzyme
MRLAVLGVGIIGTTIGRRWQDAGHEVVYGVRDPRTDRYREMAGELAISAIADAVGASEATLMAIPGSAVGSLLDDNREVLDGRLLLDASNDTSGAQFHHIPLYEERVPASRVYRAFNTLGWENFATPLFDGQPADLFYSGPDGDDVPLVEQLIADVGLRPVRVGASSAGADLLDGLTRLWFTLALQQGRGRHLAFRMLQ